MAIPAAYLASLLTPGTPVGSAPIGAGARLGQQFEAMRSNRAQEKQSQQKIDMARQAFDAERQQAEQERRQKALVGLHAALQDPDDWTTLQFAVSQARGVGIDISGLDKWKPRHPEPEGPLGDAVATTPEQAGEKAHEGLRAGAALDFADDHGPGEFRDTVEPQGAPDWMNQYMAQELNQTPQPAPEWLQNYMAKEQGVPPAPPAEPITFEQADSMAAAASSAPMPPSMNAAPPGPPPGLEGDQMGQIMAGVPGEGEDDVVISMDGQQVARVSARDVMGYREAQAGKVAQVFEPFKQNARTPSEQRASVMGQDAARRAANGGLSRKEAVLFGAEVYNRALGRDDAAEALRAKAKAFGRGGGGKPDYKERTAERLEQSTDVNMETKILQVQGQLFNIRGANDALAKAKQGMSMLQSKDRISQNTAVTTWVHSLAGSAQTRQEIENLTGGLDMMTRLDELKSKWLGGQKSDQVRTELLGVLRTMAGKLQDKKAEAGRAGYEMAKGNGLGDETAMRIYQNLAGISKPEKKRKPKDEGPPASIARPKSPDEEADELLRK